MSEWINVKDRLPRAGDVVLTYDEIKLIKIVAYGCWNSTSPNWDCRGFPVTHWQPLPLPPESGEKK